MRTVLLIAGSLLPIVSGVIYSVSIIKGKSRPQRMTRFLLLFITGVMTVSLWASGDTSGLWLALTSFLESLLILGLSFRRGIGGRDKLDIICLGLCLLGVLLWILTNQPWVGLVASIVVDLIACIPSLKKTIRLPHTEIASFYLLGTIAGLLVSLAGPFTLAAMILPAYIALVNLVFVFVIVWPRNKRLALAEEERPAGLDG